MRFKRIRSKMLFFILPVIIAAFLALTLISAYSCSSMLTGQIGKSMDATLKAETGTIDGYLNTVQSTAAIISDTVASTYKTLSLAEYEEMLEDIIKDNDMVLGSGLWFEPYVYDETAEYTGPYVYKDGDSIAVTYDYSNAEYDYFSQEYYTLAKNAEHPVITDPYYDETTGLIMSSCSAPLFEDGRFIGCVTVDMELSSIQNAVNSIKVGEGGSAMLITGDGVYIGGVSEDKVSGSMSVLDEKNTSLQAAGNEILSSAEGQTSYTDDEGIPYNLYYKSIAATGWHIIIQMPKEELFTPTLNLVIKLAVIGIAALVICILTVLFQIALISKNIRRVQLFAGSLSEGNFTIDPLSVKTADELGTMGNSLNEMYASNKAVIQNISDHASDIHMASNHLKESSALLLDEFTNIRASMTQINEAMMSASAATEEVNASTEEVDAAISVLASETEESMRRSKEIHERADSVEAASRNSSESAARLSSRFEKQLHTSIENAKIVENIGELASVIAGIAGQINMLSLNASIEAARAGEQGRGFAVVAGEIGKLAGETASAVNRIQETIAKVQAAFGQLTEDAQGMLSFVQETVTQDYQKFVATAGQYGQDAIFIAEASGRISDMSSNIKQIMTEVTQAVLHIAESSQSTADISGSILSTVEGVAGTVREVADMSTRERKIADDLTIVVNKFQLS